MEKGVRQLRYFVEVARVGSYSRAAERLYITQAPLTRQVKALEQALGTELIRRHSPSVSLTPAGEGAAKVFGHCLDRLDLAIQRIIETGRRDQSNFQLGVPWWANLSRLSEIDALARDFLGYEGVEVTICPSATGAYRVRSGLLDAALVAQPIDVEGLVVKPVASIGVYAALPEEHPLARRKTVSIASLNELPAFLIFERRINPLQYRFVMQYCTAMGLTPKRVIHVDDATSMLQQVAAGNAATLFNDISCPNLDFAGVALRPFNDDPALVSRVSLVSRPDNPIPVPDKLRNAICSLMRPTPLAHDLNAAAALAA